LEQETNIPLASFLIFLSYLVLFNTMIPISLIVSLEIVKIVQGVFIQQDKLLFNERKQKGVTVFSSSLNE
jgi:magnesium-transporting ATPase (P-type)